MNIKVVTENNACYSMSAKNKPVLNVNQGEIFRLETKDCYSNKLKTEKDFFTREMWDTVNPATGPVFINGTKKGDILKIEILEIKIRDFAIMSLEHGSGALGEFIEGQETSVLPVKDGKLVINEKLSLPVNPMIGVIGTATEENTLNGTPGEHGSNMDCKIITAGSTVYLPVNVEGALLAAGDIHALMGDGEACICGAEVSGSITMRATVASRKIPTPCVETDAAFYFIGSAKSLDECEKIVLGKAHKFLKDVIMMKANEAARIMSLVGDLQVCQVVDPLKTMRFAIPKHVLPNCSEGVNVQ
jgi:amidase